MQPRSSPPALGRCAVVASVVFAVILVRTAWISDDAFITLRTIDNFVNGYGLRWNIAERVQTFTHPAWLMLLTPAYAVTREPYFTTLAVQGGLAIATMFLLIRVVAWTLPHAAMAAALMVSSKAIVDFSTSGLENPLTHLALLGVFVGWWQRKPYVLWLAASLALLARQDLVLLVLPVLSHALLQRMQTPRGGGNPRRWRPVLVGLTPLIAWHAFAFVYYGTIMPNTALAKLPIGVPAGELIEQGSRYWVATFRFDPVTVVAILVGVLALPVVCGWSGAIVAAGALLYAAYVVRVGGDFMSGRFLTPVLFWIVLGVAGLPWRTRSADRSTRAFVLAGVVLVWGLLAVDTPPLLSGAGFGAQAVGAEIVDHDGVTDERRFYYPSMGLLPRLGFTREWREISWIDTGNAVRTRTTAPQVIAASNVGMFGFYAGPAVHVIDRNALCDPLLSRLPPRTPWRIGHFTRELPAGYLEGWRSGTNGLVDPGLRQFYERIRRVTQGPVWSIARFRDMFVLLLRSADGL